jgi:glycosyltransferase involved in cell wall biosynthesis
MERVIAYIRQTHPGAELIIVDDGSSDRTRLLAEGFARENPEARVLANPGNRGKGYAVRNGMLAATGEWVLFSDADLSAPIEECGTLLAAAQAGGASIAIGSRAINRKLIAVRQPFFREYSGRLFNLAMKALTGLPFEDTQCGFKLYSRESAQAVFSRQTLDGFGFDVEDLVIAKILGIRTIEVPVRWSNVTGSKVGVMQGFQSFLDLIRIRWKVIAGSYRP